MWFGKNKQKTPPPPPPPAVLSVYFRQIYIERPNDDVFISSASQICTFIYIYRYILNFYIQNNSALGLYEHTGSFFTPVSLFFEIPQ